MARLRMVMMAVASLLLATVAPARPGVAAELRLLTWADYVAPEVIARFEKEAGVTVVLDTIDNYADLRARFLADPGRYDLVNPADYHVADLAALGLLDRIEASRLPGYANILDGWRSPPYDPRNEWSVPFHWGTTSFVVDTGVYRGDIDSTRLLFDPPPELKGKVGFMIGAEETLRMLLIHLGLPPCTSDRAVLEQAMAHLRPTLHKDRIYTSTTIVEALTSGRVAVGVAWNGDALKAREVKPGLRFAFPREGVTVWSDVLVVPKGAANREAALAFIDFLLRPANAALQSNYTRYANAVRGSDAHMDPALLDAPEVVVPSGARIQFFRSCGREQMDMYSEIWDRTLQELVK
ncbi:MAG TPA: extracellular solute-binding protein [Azospirillum sp.]